MNLLAEFRRVGSGRGSVDLLFDLWRLQRPTTAFRSWLAILEDPVLSGKVKWELIDYTVKTFPEQYTHIFRNLEVERISAEFTGQDFATCELKGIIKEHLFDGYFNSKWNRDIFERKRLDKESLFLCDLKNVEPMILLNWHRTDLSRPMRYYLQYLTANRSNSPLSLRRITRFERSEFEYVYDVIGSTFDMFVQQYESLEGKLSKDQSTWLSQERYDLLYNLALLGQRQVVNGVLNHSLQNTCVDALDYLRSSEGLDNPLQEKLCAAFNLSPVKPFQRTILSSNQTPSYKTMQEMILEQPVENPRLDSYLRYVGGLDYPLTRELIRSIEFVVKNSCGSRPVAVVGRDSSRLCALLQQRNPSMRIATTETSPSFLICTSPDDFPSESWLSAQPGLHGAVLIAEKPTSILGMDVQTCKEVAKHLISNKPLAVYIYTEKTDRKLASLGASYFLSDING
jgi:hypothetical protein